MTAETIRRHPAGTRDVRLFWMLTAASATSKLGNQFLLVGVPLLIYQLTGSAASAVLSAAAQNAPYLIGPVVGPYIDGLSRRRLFIASELVSAGAVALIPVALAHAHQPLLATYGLVFVVGCAAVVTSLTNDFTFIPALLGEGEREVQRSYALYNTVLDMARFAGPAAAGMTIAVVGASWALWFDAATFLVTALAATRLPDDRKWAVAREPFTRSFALGWARFRHTPGLPALTTVLTVYNIGVGSIAVFIVSLGVGPWGWTSSTVGWAISFGSLAAAGGAWAGRYLFRSYHPTRRIEAWLVCSAASSLGMLTGLSWCVVGSFMLMSFAAGGFNVETLTYRRSIIADEYAGRVNSIIRFFIAGAVPISAIVMALGAGQPDSVKFVPVVASAVVAAVAWGWVGRRLRTTAP